MRILVVDSDKLHAVELAVCARVIAPEFAGTHHGDTDLPRFGRRAHSLLIPPEALFGSESARGANA